VAADAYKIPAEFPGPQTLVNNYSMDANRDLISFSCYTDEKLYPTIDKLVLHVASMSVNVGSLYVQDNTRSVETVPIETAEVLPQERRKGFLKTVGDLIKSKS
jgi:hypothetical protein